MKKEADWIIAHCRKGDDEKVGFRKKGITLKQEELEEIAKGAMKKQGNFKGQSMNLRDIAKFKMDPNNQNSEVKL